MGSKHSGKMIVPVKINGEILTLRDETMGISDFVSSCCLVDRKILLKGDADFFVGKIYEDTIFKKNRLIVCTKFGKSLAKCNQIYFLMYFLVCGK
jgi:hypothetical protein